MSVVRVKVGDVVVAETTADKIVRVEGNVCVTVFAPGDF